jgi:hypothetical protein
MRSVEPRECPDLLLVVLALVALAYANPPDYPWVAGVYEAFQVGL